MPDLAAAPMLPGAVDPAAQFVPPTPAGQPTAPAQPLQHPPEPPPVELVYERPAALDHEQLEELYRQYLEQGKRYAEQLQSDLTQATRYYAGEPLGDEEEGRSAALLTVVRDTCRAALPSLLRSLVGVNRPAEFAPRLPADEAGAEQATAWVSWAFLEQNSGWLQVHDAVLDALVRRVGFVRWWWDDSTSVATETYDNLVEPQLQAVLSEPGVTALHITRRAATQADLQAFNNSPEGQVLANLPGLQPLMLYRATVTRRHKEGRPVLRAVPGEQVYVDPDAATLGEARRLFHVRQVTVSDLIARGFDPELVIDAAQAPKRPERVAAARDPAGAQVTRPDPDDPSQRSVLFGEGWLELDLDGDGIGELLCLSCVGDPPKLLKIERADHLPFACFSALREPFRIIGQSLADMTMDLQRIESHIMRAVLDSMMSAIFPRTAYVEGQVNSDDVLNTEVGAAIRMKQPGMVQEMAKAFLGP